MTHAHVLPFDAPADAASADLDSVGGKGSGQLITVDGDAGTVELLQS